MGRKSWEFREERQEWDQFIADRISQIKVKFFNRGQTTADLKPTGTTFEERKELKRFIRKNSEKKSISETGGK